MSQRMCDYVRNLQIDHSHSNGFLFWHIWAVLVAVVALLGVDPVLDPGRLHIQECDENIVKAKCICLPLQISRD